MHLALSRLELDPLQVKIEDSAPHISRLICKTIFENLKIHSMGTFRKNVMGNVAGKVGNVSGSSWRGKSIIKASPGPRKKGSLTQRQKVQQAKFGIMVAFLRPLTNLLNETFDRKGLGMTGFNKAFAYNIVQTITGEFPDFKIDYSKVQLSRGSQTSVALAKCSSPSAGKLMYTWPYTGANTGIADDLVYVAAYEAETNHWIYSIGEVSRKAGTVTMDLTGLTGKAFYTYIGAISPTGITSNSDYLGLITVA
jgi:hypothetical protein